MSPRAPGGAAGGERDVMEGLTFSYEIAPYPGLANSLHYTEIEGVKVSTVQTVGLQRAIDFAFHGSHTRDYETAVQYAHNPGAGWIVVRGFRDPSEAERIHREVVEEALTGKEYGERDDLFYAEVH